MRTLIIFVVAIIPALAQSPVARVNNTTRVGSATFQIGDRFELLVTGPAHQSVSIRTTRDQGRTDWGPTIGWTDASGRWSVSGQFGKADFGP